MADNKKLLVGAASGLLLGGGVVGFTGEDIANLAMYLIMLEWPNIPPKVFGSIERIVGGLPMLIAALAGVLLTKRREWTDAERAAKLQAQASVPAEPSRGS